MLEKHTMGEGQSCISLKHARIQVFSSGPSAAPPVLGMLTARLIVVSGCGTAEISAVRRKASAKIVVVNFML